MIVAGVFNPLAYDGRVQRASKALAEMAEVTVVCPAGPAMRDDLPFDVVPIRDRWRGFATSYIAFCIAFVAKAVRARPDVIHAHDYFMGPPGLIAALLTGAKLVYDAHELIIPEKGVLRKPILRIFAWIERVVVPRADLVIAANDERADQMRRYFALARAPLVIRNIPPPDDRPLLGEASVRRCDRRTPGEFVVVYQGHLKLQRGLGRILEAFEHLPDGFRLVVVGGGPDQEAMLREIEERGLKDRVGYLGRVPRSELRDILEKFDAGLLSYSYDTLNDRLCAPNKVFEYAQAGLPVLATDQLPLRRMVEEYGIGRLIREDDSAREIAETIRMLSRQPKTSYEASLTRFLAEHRWEREAVHLREGVRRIQ